MSMKKAFDQTIRDIKREVNKKVLKVPSIEQKVLDATSNEPWGPHGSLLADIAQATRNYHEYQMIMAVIWKRINDTGKNWRHVYKALTVLEYLVAHGSERVIDEIREHAYQISTLSDFQYIDSSGRDQGNNVRRKSQSLVLLVNDKERIQEVRQKAASNRDKFRSSSAAGGMYRPGGYGEYEGRGGRDDNGYGREREWGYRDDERYGRYGDSYNREGDRYGRDSEEQYGRDSYRDDDSRGRSRSVDDYQYGSRSRSSDRDRDRAYDDDDRHSRGSSVRAEDHQQDGRQLERKFSEQNLGAPPSYEEALGDSRSPTYSERDGETSAASAPHLSSPTASAAPQSLSPVANAAPQSSSPIANAAPKSSSPTGSFAPSQATVDHGVLSHDAFDEFDPRGSFSATANTSNNAEMDLLGSLTDVFSPNALTIMPASPGTAEADAAKTASNPTFAVGTSENNVLNQTFEDPFGDSPFKAVPSDELSPQPQNLASVTSFQPAMNTEGHTQAEAQKVDTVTTNMEFSDGFTGLTFNQTNVPDVQTPHNAHFLPQEPQSQQDNDILAGILPPGPLPTTASQTAFFASTGLPPATASQTAFPVSTGQPPAGLDFMPHLGYTGAPFPHMTAQNLAVPSGQFSHQNSLPYSAPSTTLNSNVALQAPTGTPSHQNNDFLGDLLPHAGPINLPSSQSAPSSSAGPLALVPQQPANEKFEPKSAVWADTLSRGLVNLNISGQKVNPLSDIGIDFESLNRKEKRMEKPSAAPATSNVTMGKAMGSGSGIGRAGAVALRPQVNPMMGTGMGMGIGMGMGMGMGGGAPGVAMGMGGYGSMNQQPMGMGMNMGGMGMNMGGMGMNMGMGQGGQRPPSNGVAPGSNMSNYNPMMGRGGYPQQPYGGGYR